MKKILLLLPVIIAYYLLPTPSRGPEVVFFDVGQGDGWVMRTQSGKVILVDGGEDWRLIPLLDRYLGPKTRKIDIMIATHAHSDHMASLPEIVERYEVGSAILPLHFGGHEASSLMASLKEEGAEVFRLQGERCLALEEHCNLCICAGNQDAEDENDNSLITRWECGELSVLGTGDAGVEREKDFINLEKGRVDVLKVGHHGSNTSSSRELIQMLRPEISYISVGMNNAYGHPSDNTLKTLGGISHKIWRSDELGSLRIYANNKEIIGESWP